MLSDNVYNFQKLFTYTIFKDNTFNFQKRENNRKFIKNKIFVVLSFYPTFIISITKT